MKTNIFPSRFYNILGRFLFLTTLMLTGATQTFAETTWTGAINSDWNNMENWSYGLPYLGQEVAIAASPHNPVLAAGASVTIKAIAVQESALLTIQETASLTLDGMVLTVRAILRIREISLSARRRQSGFMEYGTMEISLTAREERSALTVLPSEALSTIAIHSRQQAPLQSAPVPM